MIVVENRLFVAEEYADQFVERFRNSMGEVESQPGFVKFELLTPARPDTDSYVAQTYWESMADFEAWTDTDAFREAHADRPPREMFTDKNQLEVHEVSFERTGE
ncbi:antibiotic biosynthesis monooxygenase [Haladaptatus sp. W1]|uniref:antibiotic biosynthesis monooxygenase family protein n=1 Tax=Haladaptatus sp. W1 TaxID=1897478 RepID=UPI0008498834|nr:antibiotic biosynthesis monooxygenase [Haladaptatus sp. W1]ODR82362.1 antibiotic biosynthesis monooxygenase [Haladaptatus sp. W1]